MKKTGLMNIEKNIRAEQRISDAMGKSKNYRQTSSYKNLNNNQKKDFNRYLESKHTIIKFLSLFVLLGLLILIPIQTRMTGNSIKEFIGTDNLNALSFVIIIALVILVIAIISILYKKK